MEDDQQFCLRWNNHQSTLIQNFDTLLESGTLVDCTLAAEGKTLKAHKVVLSACSPYFECLLSEHYDKHPVFILKDVKFKELKAMMDYMYRGEVNISQDQLAALLKAAESLQIKGLSESKTAGSSKTESRLQKTVSQPTAPSLDIPHASSGLTIEKNKVPRQSLAQSSVGDIPEDTASPQVSKGMSSREGSQSPTSRKRKRFRRRSLTEDSTIENQDASNSSDMPQQMGVPALGITPVADEKVHADPTDSLGRSALMTQLTKPADEMLQLPLEKPEPNDNLIEPKSEYLDDAEEGVEDLTLDEDMNDLNDIEQDNNRAGPSHDPAQHPAGMGSWHVTGDRSNAGGVVGSVAAPGTGDEVFLAAQEAAQAHRDSQGIVPYEEKQNSSYFIVTSPEQHLGLHIPSLQSYDSASFRDSNIFGFDRYSENVTKQQQQQQQRDEGHRRYLCPKCGNSYKYLGDMKKHLRFQCGQEPRFECPYCQKRTKVSSNMYAHVRAMHSDQPMYIIDLYNK
ncbi:PREDICTED: longitudinals lacking protein, isoforms A/B/D/L isoform X6 [Trachymyrmex cornetzi]|uniref:longitudinals lacking protein, isoforms A/B/D/L isoform X6 n=1 Tax=Trachymyrmex cornetzi TaxID=471704 RepID=UPI00084F2816|nr:PREDICTED: longitudinals lacking protein, isoforms A/B/D/L isoform X6 [Trachymyrmex cornetzi]